MSHKTFIQVGGRSFAEDQLIAAVRASEELYEAFARTAEENGGGSHSICWDALSVAWAFRADALSAEQRFQISARYAECNGAAAASLRIRDHHREWHRQALRAAALSRADGAAHARLMDSAGAFPEYFRDMRALAV